MKLGLLSRLLVHLHVGFMIMNFMIQLIIYCHAMYFIRYAHIENDSNKEIQAREKQPVFSQHREMGQHNQQGHKINRVI